jgi:hypothetical protein
MWAELLQSLVPAAVPLLLISRAGAEWLDAIIGEPASDDFFCLQASPKAMPLASQIPYDLNPELRMRLQKMEAKFLGAESTVRIAPPGATPANVLPPGVAGAAARSSPARRNFNWLMILAGIFILAGVVAGVWLFSGNRDSPSKTTPPVASTGSAPATTEVAATLLPPERPKTNELAGDEAKLKAQPADQTRVEAETKRLAEAKRIADEKIREEARLKAQTAEKAKTEKVRVEDANAQDKARDSDADLAQIALAQGRYERALEISRKWPGAERFKEIVVRIAAETNQLFQVTEYLKAGNYAPIFTLTNQLPDNSKFKEVIARAEVERKLLDGAKAEFARGDYGFLQRPELQELKTKPPFQKLLQEGAVEAEQLKQAQVLKAENKPQAARDFIGQSKVNKPPFTEIQKWATTELERTAGQQRDQQAAEGAFNQGDYARALELCKKYAGVVTFDALAKNSGEEQALLADAQKKFGAGNYSFAGELAGRPYQTKPPFVELLRKAADEQKTLGGLEKLKQSNDWQKLQADLSRLPAAESAKVPFDELRKWAQVKATEDEALKGKDPAWLDAELEVLLVRFNVLSPKDRWIQSPEARKEKTMDGFLALDAKEYYLNRIKWLRSEYGQRGWLNQRDRKKYLDKLESTVNAR